MSNNALAVATFLVSVVLTIVVGVLLQGWDPQLGLIASEAVTIFLPAAVVALLLHRRTDAPALGLRPRFRLPLRWLPWLLLTSCLLGIAANAVTGVLATSIAPLGEIAKAYEAMFMELMYPAQEWRRGVAIAAIVVVAPLCEEFLFRGVILPLQRSDGRPVGALLMANGFMFSLLHLNPLNFLALLAVGAFFAHLAVLTGSVWPSVVAHATLNLVNGVFAPELLQTSTSTLEPSLAGYALATAVLVPLVALCWRYGAQRLQRLDLTHA